MSIEAYELLLKEIATKLETELAIDDHGTCLLRMANGIHIHIEPDREAEHVIVGANLGVVPTGSYRENLFRTAMIINGSQYPRYGIFAYSRQNKQLVLFEKRSLRQVTTEEILDILDPFSEKALVWRDAITNEEIPSLPPTSTATSARMFGL